MSKVMSVLSLYLWDPGPETFSNSSCACFWNFWCSAMLSGKTGSLTNIVSTPLLKIGSLDIIWVPVCDRANPTRAWHANARILSASENGVLV